MKQRAEFSLIFFWHRKIRLCNEKKENLQFSTFNKQFSDYRLKYFITKGAVIFNAGYQDGRKLLGGRKLQQLRSQSMKSIGRPRPGYEKLFNNSSKSSWSLKTAGHFLRGTTLVRSNLRNATFSTSIVTELFIKGRKLNISLVFIT